VKTKPIVWYVDDLPLNLERFKNNHQEAFTIRTFATPEQVKSALVESTPDALLCDVFFYETVAIAEDMESRVKEKADEIRKFGEDIEANKIANQAGVPLIQFVSEQFGNRFPIYAYTSKGPYLLDELAFDRIGDAGAKWLFKGKYGKHTEQIVIQHDIEDFRLKHSFSMRVARYFWAATFGSGILGGLVVWFLTEELPRLLQNSRH
jgi:hypothetical protein